MDSTNSAPNAMSVDVEDYFQVSAFAPYIRRDAWDRQPQRLEHNLHQVLEIFAEHRVAATFFWLGWAAEGQGWRFVNDGHCEPGARLLAMQGPIVLEAGTHVGANAVIYGPTWVGPQTRVNAQATIGPHVVLGPHCKVGGEVKSACLHGYSNKAHSGFLGNAIVGEWVNLGADTTVSNLKNTYGSVRVQLDPDGVPEDTGRTFHGPIIGDHVLTAVGTRLLTGTCIGTGAMVTLSGFAPKYVAGMCFHTDGSAQPYDLPAFITSARRRMARRGVEPSEAMIARWHALAQRAL